MLDEKTQDFIRTHREEDVRRLALKPAPENVDLRMALQQIEGWQTARRKLPSWAERDGIQYPPRLPMEQCSSEQTARYKQALVKRLLDNDGTEAPHTLMDLTGGSASISAFWLHCSTGLSIWNANRNCAVSRHITSKHWDWHKRKSGKPTLPFRRTNGPTPLVASSTRHGATPSGARRWP